MGRSVSLATMRSKILARYDLPVTSGTTYVTDSVLTEFINGSVTSYVGILMRHELEEYYTYEETVTTTPGLGYYLTTGLTAAQFQGIRAITWVRGTDDAVPLRRAQTQEFYLRSWSSQAWDCVRPAYALIRDRIYFMPPPSGAQTLCIFYQGIPQDLAADGDTFYAGPGWEEWIVSDVCRKIAEREDQDPARFYSARQSAEQAIEESVNRENAGPVFAQRLMFRDDRINSWDRKDR